jgi:hypothetical protein
VEGERGLAEYSFDYCFPGNEMGYKLTVLVGRERTTGMSMAAVLPSKGSSGKFAADKVMEFLAECGNMAGDIIIKSDQEAAIAYLIKDIVLERGDEKGCRTIVEESPVGSSGSNGIVERAVQTVEGQIRVMKLALEDRIGKTVDAEANIVTFMAEYASYMLNRLEVGKDGKTAYERTKGKAATVLGVEFGEKLLWRKRSGQKMNKINSKWEYGIFVGVRPRSGELWVATQDGVYKTRSVRRMSKEDRWTPDCVSWVKHVPWHRYKDQEDADGDIPEEKAVEAEAKETEAGNREPTIVVKTRRPPPRAFQIRKEDAEKYGYTRGCAGCSSWFRGLGRQPHSTSCRERFAEVMKDEARYKNSEARKSEFEDKMERKRARKQQKGEEDEKMKDEAKNEEMKAGSLMKADSLMAGGSSGAASSGLDRTQEKRAREDDWKEFAESIKRKSSARTSLVPAVPSSPGDEDSSMDVAKVMIDKYWEEIIDKEIEDKMISEIKAEMNEEEVEMGPNLMEEWAWDDVKGKQLDESKVKEARLEEVTYMIRKGVWKEVEVDECWRTTGKDPVTIKWVDTDKGEGGEVKIRSRLVARDFRVKGEKDREDLFAATPPLELLRILISKAATVTKDGGWRKLLFVDVKKAHLNPKCEQDVYFWLPDEAGPKQGMCGKLVHWLYGFRPAAQAWETHYATKMEEVGFVRGQGISVAFWHPDRDLACVVHGDDFTFSGMEEDLDWIEGMMKSWFEVKVRARLGPEPGDDKEISVLGRQVTWEDWGITYRADEKHRNIILERFGLDEGSKGLVVSGKAEDPEENEELLEGPEITEFRAMAARLNFMAQDCPDVQFAAKEICREMAGPTGSSWSRVKRLARYLLLRTKAVFEYEWLYEEPSMDQYTDSDWAGCRRTRKSTTGGVTMRGPHCLKSWSVTQGPIALSSAEAEYYAMVDGVIKAMGVQTMCDEVGVMGMKGPIVLHTDSSAAKSFASRRGLGRARHVHTRCLWLQKAVADRLVLVRKVAGTANPADLLTKFLTADAIERTARLAGIRLFWRSDAKRARTEGG